MDYGKLAIEAAKIGLNPTGYLLSQIAESTSRNVTHSDAAADKELTTLRIEAERQELQMRISEAQARVAQEIAIARRIESADEVEMEEFYDYSGEASVGGKLDEKGVFVGAGGSPRFQESCHPTDQYIRGLEDMTNAPLQRGRQG